jgi:hypothetical protein
VQKTAIGIFSSRDQAEYTVQALQQHGVPQESIVFLAGSDSDAQSIAQQFGVTVGAFVGMAVGMSAGVVIAALRFSSVETMFVLGFSAAALLGWLGACAGARVARVIGHDSDAPLPTSNQESSQAAELFRYAVSDGRSLVVVRTEAQEVADAARAVLNEAGGGM